MSTNMQHVVIDTVDGDAQGYIHEITLGVLMEAAQGDTIAVGWNSPFEGGWYESITLVSKTSNAIVYRKDSHDYDGEVYFSETKVVNI